MSAEEAGAGQSSTRAVDTGLLSLAVLARLQGKPAQPEQLRHELGLTGPASADDLLRAAKRLDLKAKKGALDVRRLDAGTAPLPCIVERSAGGFAVLARYEQGKALIHDPVEGRPRTLSTEEMRAELNGRAVFVVSRAILASELARFDFTWFVPAIVKYRRLIGEALLASLALQVFALLTPLFFQVVVDKVLVHKGLSTLTVIAIGLLGAVLFESALTALRTYVFAHTTSRIDVELGARLFRHVLALPLAYFEARRVGDTVARVRELENIRQFLTSHSVTVVLDLFFTAVFLAVMWFYSPILTLVVMGSLPLYAVLSVVITPAIRARLHEKFNRGAENQSFLVEAICGIQTVKALAVEPPLLRKWEEQLAGYVRASFRTTTVMTIAGQTATCIQKVTTVAVLWVGAYRVIDGDLTIGQLIAFNMLSAQVTGPLLRLVNLWQELQQVGISVQRLGDILNTQPEPSYNPNRTTLPQVYGHIVFDEVTFRYRPDGSE